MGIKVKFGDHSADAMMLFHQIASVLIEEIGMEAERNISLNAPVGSPESTGIDGYRGGTLRNSINQLSRREGDKYKAYVGTNLYYAPYVEFGTGIYADSGNGRKEPWIWVDKNGDFHKTQGMKPRHFMRNGVEETAKKFPEIFGRYKK